MHYYYNTLYIIYTDIFITITVLISVTGHVVLIGILNYFFHYLVYIPFAFSKCLSWWWFFVTQTYIPKRYRP